MPLVQLCYASTVADGVHIDEINTLVKRASVKNESMQITGFLCANAKYFLQCIEGERSDINRLYNHITQDARHYDVTLIGYGDITGRRFAEWSMGVVTQVDTHKELIKRYNNSEVFNPYELKPRCSVRLLTELSCLR